MGFWDSLKSAAGQWAEAASAQNKADDIIERLSGINPKHFHPEVYKAAAQAAHQQHERYRQASANPATDEEMAMVKLIVLYILSRDAAQEDKCAAFGRAIRSLRKEAGPRVRAELSLEATAETGF